MKRTDPWSGLAEQARPLYADIHPPPPGLARRVLARIRPAPPRQPDAWRWCAAAAALAAAALILATFAVPFADGWQLIALEPVP